MPSEVRPIVTLLVMVPEDPVARVTPRAVLLDPAFSSETLPLSVRPPLAPVKLASSFSENSPADAVLLSTSAVDTFFWPTWTTPRLIVVELKVAVARLNSVAVALTAWVPRPVVPSVSMLVPSEVSVMVAPPVIVPPLVLASVTPSAVLLDPAFNSDTVPLSLRLPLVPVKLASRFSENRPVAAVFDSVNVSRMTPSFACCWPRLIAVGLRLAVARLNSVAVAVTAWVPRPVVPSVSMLVPSEVSVMVAPPVIVPPLVLASVTPSAVLLEPGLQQRHAAAVAEAAAGAAEAGIQVFGEQTHGRGVRQCQRLADDAVVCVVLAEVDRGRAEVRGREVEQRRGRGHRLAWQRGGAQRVDAGAVRGQRHRGRAAAPCRRWCRPA